MIYERNNNDPIYSTVPGRLGSVTEVSDLTGRIHGPRAEVEERNVPDVEVPVEPHAGDVLILDDDRLADLAGLLVAAAQAAWHYRLIRHRTREGCFTAFRQNHWLGLAVFAGVVADLALR